MNAIELFAGVGGFRLGLEQHNIEVVYANEWDRYACDVYDQNFGSADSRMERERQADIRGGAERQESQRPGHSGAYLPQAERPDGRLGDKPRPESDNGGTNATKWHRIDRRDLTTVPASDIPPHDLIAGGFPCQAFSIAGKRLGFDETRGTLFFEILRIARHHRTPYLLLENVKGLLNHDGGRTFETILGALDESGYDCQWQVLNSKDFGVPQNRERIYIVGHLRGQPRPEVFPIVQDDAEAIELQGQYANTLTARYEGAQATGTYVAQGQLDAQGLVRRLTPVECERLQAFPDNWTASVSDTQRYKQMGNAVTVSVVSAVAERLAKVSNAIQAELVLT